MVTLIDWSQLHSRVESYFETYGHRTMSRALAHVVLEALLDLSPDEVDSAITDAGQDRGIDAVFVDDRDGKNDVHLFSFKYANTFDSSQRNFPGNEIDKVLSFISDLMAKKSTLQTECNELLWVKVTEIWDSFRNRTQPMFHIHLCSNMEPLNTAERQRFETSLLVYRHFTLYEHTLSSIVRTIISGVARPVDRTLTLVDLQYFERSDGKIRGLIGTAEAASIVDMIRDPENSTRVLADIFNENVRIYLGRTNRINLQIIGTALSEENFQFWYLNNGITITCDQFDYMPRTRAPVVRMRNVQIVNGGQTSNALFEAYQQNKERIEDVLLLVRIYETRDREISVHIAESTNSQTPIKSRDLRANDFIQRQLEQSFLDLGYFYERKRAQYQGQGRDRRIDLMTAGQACLAYYLEQPEVAKKDKARIVGDQYDEVFNDEVTAAKILTPVMLLKDVEARKRMVQEKIRGGEVFATHELCLIDGVYHVLYTVSLLCDAHGTNPEGFEAAREMVQRAVEIVGGIVVREAEKNPAFTTSRFFKDAKTKRLLQQEVSQSLPAADRAPLS